MKKETPEQKWEKAYQRAEEIIESSWSENISVQEMKNFLESTQARLAALEEEVASLKEQLERVPKHLDISDMIRGGFSKPVSASRAFLCRDNKRIKIIPMPPPGKKLQKSKSESQSRKPRKKKT